MKVVLLGCDQLESARESAECCTCYAMPSLTLKVYCTNIVLAESEHVGIQFKVFKTTQE